MVPTVLPRRGEYNIKQQERQESTTTNNHYRIVKSTGERKVAKTKITRYFD